MKIKFIFPFVIFIAIMIVLWRGLTLHPAEIPSPLIDHPIPVFKAPLVFDSKKNMTNQDFIGHVTLFHVWATWCDVCVEEHPFLVQLSKNSHVIFYGLNYKEDPATVRQWLKKHGNPYRLLAVDETGDIAIDWGVYGTPETFLIDKKGNIRFKWIGEMTPETWEESVKPKIQLLQKETS